MKMVINGEWVGSLSDRTYTVKNPANGEAVGPAPLGVRDDVKRAADAAEEALSRWGGTSSHHRGQILARAAARIREQAEEIAIILTAEQGKPQREAIDEVRGAARVFEYYAGLSSNPLATVQHLEDGSEAMVLREPIGVCGAILPWNMPALLMAWKVGPALLTGNTVVLKPATATPLTPLMLASALHDAGLPNGVLNVVTGAGDEVGEEIVRSKQIRKVSFTGSTQTGKRIMTLAAHDLKRLTLELGGSDPMIICADADIPKAVAGAVAGRFYNAGQICTAVKRLYVVDAVADQVIEQLTEKVGQITVGDGMKPEVKMGPLSSLQGRESIRSIVRQVVDREEGRVIAGGELPQGDEYLRGNFYTPTLVTDVAPDSILLREEIFGPVLPIVRVKDVNEAITAANSTRYGLGASVWTSDPKTIRAAIGGLKAGIVWVNQHLKIPPEVPFGGVKESGVGRENGIQSLDAYTEAKTVLVRL